MSRTEQAISLKGFKEEAVEDRVSRLKGVDYLFKKGSEEGVFTFEELRSACSFLSTLVKSVDGDAGDLCLLASHAEKVEQVVPICEMSRQRWARRKDVEDLMERISHHERGPQPADQKTS